MVHFLVIAEDINKYLELVEKNKIRGKSTMIKPEEDKTKLYKRLKEMNTIFYQVNKFGTTKIENLKTWCNKKTEKELKALLDLLNLRYDITLDKLKKESKDNEELEYLENCLYSFLLAGFDITTSMKMTMFLNDERKRGRIYNYQAVINLWIEFENKIKEGDLYETNQLLDKT